jgi:hypothetical protein
MTPQKSPIGDFCGVIVESPIQSPSHDLAVHQVVTIF